MNYQKRFDYEITTAALLQKLRTLNNKSNSFLKSEKKVIVMCGFSEDSHLCYHLKLTNEHTKYHPLLHRCNWQIKAAVTDATPSGAQPFREPVIFNIQRPYGRAFGVTPHIGTIMPNTTITIYCTFRSERVARIPDDGIFIYSIFQKAISESDLNNAKTPKEKERVARKFWSRFRGNCYNCLRLPVAFEPRRPATHERHVEICADELPSKSLEATKHPSKEEMSTSQMPSAKEAVV